MVKSINKVPKGFTLVEMMVVLGIVGVISAVILTSQSGFNSSLILNDTAYTVAFSARQAQTFGISSRKYNGVQNTGYGLNFNRTTPNSYILFADTDKSYKESNVSKIPAWCPQGTLGEPDAKVGECIYVPGADTLVQNYTFTQGFKVSKFCAIANGTKYCSTDASPLQSLNIVFLRPNTSTVMTGLLNGVMLPNRVTCSEITISPATGKSTRTVRISNLGEIALNQTCS